MNKILQKMLDDQARRHASMTDAQRAAEIESFLAAVNVEIDLEQELSDLFYQDEE